MNVDKILGLFRFRANDEAKPYLWKDEELLDYLNEAEREACRRGRLLIDSTTAAYCQIAVVADTTSYSLNEKVIFIRRAKLALETLPLEQKSYKDLDREASGWDDESSSTPLCFLTDWETGKLTLYPPPDTNDTLNLRVIRLPAEDMNDGDDTPEINVRFHESLIEWMRYRAYDKDDEEAKDVKKSLKALALFEQEFGQKSAAINEEWQHRQHFDELDGEF
jgi:hypothetical protein